MKKSEILIIKLLEEYFKGKQNFKQKELAKKYQISLGLVNSTINTLARIGALEIKRFGFNVLDIKKILLYAAIKRNPYKDLIFSFYVDLPIKKIEANMPPSATFTSYTAYRLYFNESPADYSEVYVYSEKEKINEIKKRFKIENKKPNVFILRKDFEMKAKASLPLIYIDLWNLKEWYAKEFLNALEERLKNEGILE